ncbi:Rho termination factor N-terminal domain-containing protein, partial [Streptomyces sp. NPDC006324]
MSDTTDLMGVTADNSVDNAAPAAGAATGGTARRRRSGTGLEGMVLAELQQVASGLGIRGTARMRKSQLIEVIKEAQAGGGSAAPAKTAEAAETKPKRRATSKARTGETAAAPAVEAAAKAEPVEKIAGQQQIDIPGQPSPKTPSEQGAGDDQPAGERRRRRATAPAGSPDGAAPAETAQAVRTEPRTEARTESREVRAEAQTDT